MLGKKCYLKQRMVKEFSEEMALNIQGNEELVQKKKSSRITSDRRTRLKTFSKREFG